VICHPRGKKSQVVVGDRVLWLPSQDEGTIEKIEERRNLFYRQDEIRTKSFAANLDQVLILIAAEPEFSESQLARALIAAEAEHITPHHCPEQERPGGALCPRLGAPAALPPHALRRAAAVPAPVRRRGPRRTCCKRACKARPRWCWAPRAPARAR
jgi:hypothetical protein